MMKIKSITIFLFKWVEIYFNLFKNILDGILVLFTYEFHRVFIAWSVYTPRKCGLINAIMWFLNCYSNCYLICFHSVKWKWLQKNIIASFFSNSFHSVFTQLNETSCDVCVCERESSCISNWKIILFLNSNFNFLSEILFAVYTTVLTLSSEILIFCKYFKYLVDKFP